MSCINGCMVISNLVISLVPYFSLKGKEIRYNQIFQCVGCADRSAFDLQAHSKATGVSLVAEKKLSEAKTVEITEMVPNKQGLYLLLSFFAILNLCNYWSR